MSSVLKKCEPFCHCGINLLFKTSTTGVATTSLNKTDTITETYIKIANTQKVYLYSE